MSEFKNEYILNVDIKKRLASPVPVFKRGDTAILKFRIFDDGDLYDLTGFVRAELTQVLPSGKALSGEAQLEDGLIVYRYSRYEMLEIGKIITSLTIYDQNDNQVSIQPFAVYMYDEMDGKTLSYIGVLQELISEVKIIDKQTEELLGFIEENIDNLTDIIPNEQERIQSENERIENENIRKQNENQRIDSENIRVSNEEERIQNENERKISEQNRINEENIRIENENNRNTNESERIYKETVRENNESVRISNEQSREDNEYQRIQNENERIEQESERILKEGERIQNELQRQQNEQNRETIFNSQIETINNVLPNVEGLENRLSWNSTTQYFKNNIVELNGNSYQALKDNINQPPPTPPEKSNEFWSMIAQRGVDGTGAVSTVNGVFPDIEGNVELTAHDIDAIPVSEKGVAGGVARLNEEGKVVDANGNEVEGKVKSVNGMIGDVVGLETVEGATQKANQAEVNAKVYTDQQIHLVTETGIPKLVRYEYTLYPTVDNQSTFEIPLDIFDVETDSEVIVKNTVTLDPNEDYTIEGKNIVLNEPVPLNTRLTVFIYKNVPIGEEGAINGKVLANGTIAFEKLDTATKELINSKANRDELIQLQNDLNNTKDLVYTKADNVNLTSLEQTVNEHLADYAQFKSETESGKVSKSGDTMQGILTAHSNTSYTLRQVRNIVLSTDDADVNAMLNGDIWIKYESEV